jgi:3-phenylpropionate/trans-cinnamate dioxygenase ferredoxin reductase subunit
VAWTRATHLRTGALWVGLYVLLTLAPLGLVLAGSGGVVGEGRGFWREFSVALGFVGLAMMTLQFVLTARFPWLKAPFGSDVVYAFHRQISLISVALIVAHPVVLAFLDPSDILRRVNPLTAPPAGLAGTGATLALLVLVLVSVFRERLRLSYDAWRRTHAILAVLAVGLGVAHVLFVGHYLATPAQRALWLAYTLAWVGLIVYVRLIKPAGELRRPWVVERVTPRAGRAWSIALRPEGHAGLRFSPGQFAWITMFSSPFSDREHPFSFSGSAEDSSRVEFTIKELGDFTARVKNARPGERVYVDGPFGALSADRHPDAKGFVLLAAGIGITPMISHIRTFADRRDPRPLVLIYGNNTLVDAPFVEELEELKARCNLRVVHVLAKPPEGWAGERGFITREVLERHVPGEWLSGRERFEAFICGPVPMMDAVERALFSLGVPMGDFHAERFNLV